MPRNYAEFINSKEWQEIRSNHLLVHPTCYCCGTTENLHVHHCDYARFGGDELPEDLVTLCRKHHEQVHYLQDIQMARLRDAHEVLLEMIRDGKDTSVHPDYSMHKRRRFRKRLRKKQKSRPKRKGKRRRGRRQRTKEELSARAKRAGLTRSYHAAVKRVILDSGPDGMHINTAYDAAGLNPKERTKRRRKLRAYLERQVEKGNLSGGGNFFRPPDSIQ